MSRRRRSAKRSAVRARVAREKVLRRRTRAAGAARAATAATAATAAAVTLAGAGTAFAAPSDPTASGAPRSSGASVAQCPTDGPSSTPDNLTALGDSVFFAARDGIHGSELWKSDGTAAGTVLVKNINPNDSSSTPGSHPRNMTVMGDRLFFMADDGTHGEELWR